MNESPVTRLEIAAVIVDVFAAGSADRAEIVTAAMSGGSRPAVIETLAALPDRRFGRLNELWEHLADTPVGG